MLFHQIKSEQARLKEEKRALVIIRKTAPYRSELYLNITQQIEQLHGQIEHKQRDADRMRF